MTATHIPPASTLLTHTEAYLAMTNTDPMTRLPLMRSTGAHELLARADREGTATAAGFLGREVTVTLAAPHYQVSAS